jgi:hypothetical protein
MAEKLKKNKDLHVKVRDELPTIKAKFEEKLQDTSMSEPSVAAILDVAEDYFEKQLNLLITFNESDSTMLSQSLKPQHEIFNTHLLGILGAWNVYVENMTSIVKIVKRKKDTECAGKIQQLQAQISSIEEESDVEIARLTSENQRLTAELEKFEQNVASFTSTAAAAESQLRKATKFNIGDEEVTYTINNPIDEGVKPNNRKAFVGTTRFDFNKEPNQNDEEIGNYIGRDGRVYKQDGILARNGGTRRRNRQRRGRKSRR